MSDLTIFGGDFNEDHFETKSYENGFTFWLASELMELLGYDGWQSFQNPINKAMTTCTTLGIAVFDNFVQQPGTLHGKAINDVKLSRFACYLVVMNADSKKHPVAAAQAYFASLAGAVQTYLQEANNVERLIVRDEITDREKSLSGVAQMAGVERYDYFRNAGYRGMYNTNIKKLKVLRHIPDGKSLLDFMGKDELAANLFRMTQTELKIKQDNIYGQKQLEVTAERVGKQVRETMISISGIAPENLPVHADIHEVKKGLKQKNKEIKKIDKKKGGK